MYNLLLYLLISCINMTLVSFTMFLENVHFICQPIDDSLLPDQNHEDYIILNIAICITSSHTSERVTLLLGTNIVNTFLEKCN